VVPCLLLVLVTTFPLSAQVMELKDGVDRLASQLAASVPEGRALRVAVTDFPDLQGVTSDLGRYIAERLTTRLSAQTRKFQIIERRRLSLVLSELKFGMSDLVDPVKAKQLGQMLGVEGLVVGSVSDLGNQVDVDARIIEIETSNILPGVFATLSKDQVVTQLLAQGRETAAGPAPAGPAPSVGSAPTATRSSGTHPVGRQFAEGNAFVHLFNVEMLEGRLLKFNFAFEWGRWGAPLVEVYLDNPQETTFLVDQLGRQHPLVQAVGISATDPVRVPAQGSKRFSLTFQLAAGMESFKYQSTLFMRFGNEQARLKIRADHGINLRDFRMRSLSPGGLGHPPGEEAWK
jgi:TolB-like protein